MVVTDSKLLFPEILVKYHEAHVYYLGPLPSEADYEDLIRSVPTEELRAHPLTYQPQRRFPPDQPFVPYCGVERPITFSHEGQRVTDRALVVWSAGKERLDIQKRKTHLKRLLNGLKHIRRQLNTRRYKKRDYAVQRLASVQRGNPTQTLVDVALSGEDGNLQLDFRLNRDKLARAQALDGKYILATNAPHLTPDEMLITFKGQDGVDKRLGTVKGPLAVRPVFLHTPERIEVLVWINLLALLVYSVLELGCRRAGLQVTARKVLARFEYLGATYTTFADGSVLRRVASPSEFQRRVLCALGVADLSRYAGNTPLV